MDKFKKIFINNIFLFKEENFKIKFRNYYVIKY